MMSCTIVLENFNGTCSPGSTICGYISCTFADRKKIRGIRVKLRGKEHTSWTERESHYDSRMKKTRHRTVHYSGNNKFLADTLIPVGEGTMNPGRYDYPFTFTLPRNLPQTFKGIHGFITYYIKANVDIPLALDCEDKKSFIVQAPIDFNEIMPELQLSPTSYQDEKTICCFCCADGPITLDVHLQKEAFVVGEIAKVVIDVKNFSNQNIDIILLKLKSVITYTTTSPSTKHKYDHIVLGSVSSSGVGAHGQNMFEIPFEIPRSAIVYNFQRSLLIQQSCNLEVEAEIPGAHINMKTKIGVTIGHIPIRSVTNQISYPLSTIDLPPPYSAPQNASAPQEEFFPSAPPKEGFYQDRY